MSTKILAGRYELYDKIGEGGMSVVYRARDRLLNRFIAIKILKPEFVKDSKFTESFRREAQSAAGLQHPNIVNVYDVGKEGNIHYIVMELVEGQVLSDIIRENGPLHYKTALTLSKQIASALSFAHRNNIIHRDVKPHNVLLTTDGTAKITDFGIAKAINTSTIVDNNTGEGVMGSVHYFSPEQARGGYVDEKSDIYSLGIVMYEMLTGQVPFDADNPVTVALMHINNDIIPPSHLEPSIPPGIEQIVMRAVNKDPKKRFQSADEMIKALDNVEFVSRVVGESAYNPVMDQESAISEQEEEYAEGKNKKNRKKLIIILAVAAVLLISGIVVFASGLFGSNNKVPDLIGMKYSEAKDKAEEAGFKIRKGDEVYSNKVEKKEIAAQTPDADSTAKKGSVIVVDICIGHKNGIVPDLKDLSLEEAKAEIKATGFKLGTVEKEANEADKDTVINQDPEAGSSTEEGSEINLVISKGIEKVKVPNLKGLSYNAAQKTLQDAGLAVGSVSYGYSSDYKKNTVMAQQYSPGTEIPKGNSVSIRISKGEQEVEGTASVYISYSAAENDLFYMTVTVADSAGTRNVISNKQRAKNDGGETVNIRGKGKGTVIVIFDGEEVLRKNVTFK